MKRFKYKALDATGRTQSGRIDTPSESQVDGQLRRRGLTLLDLQELPERLGPRLSYKEVAILSSELSRTIHAGVPLERGLKLCQHAGASRVLNENLERISDLLTAGATPSEAFSGLQGSPGEALAAIVTSGEQAGRLGQALSASAPLFAGIARFREKMISLLMYPLIVAITAVAVLAVFMMVVVPSLRPVLQDLGDQLPMSAELLLTLSELAPMVMTGGLVSGLIFILLCQQPRFRKGISIFKHRLLASSVMGETFTGMDLALMARLFGTLLASQTPAAQALELASDVMANSVLATRLREASSRVRSGERLENALGNLLSPGHLIVQACRLGYETGDLAQSVLHAGDTLSERTETRLERLTALAGPGIIIGLGLLIGLLVVTLFSALTALPEAAGL